jgi:hypothetical protein
MCFVCKGSRWDPAITQISLGTEHDYKYFPSVVRSSATVKCLLFKVSAVISSLNWLYCARKHVAAEDHIFEVSKTFILNLRLHLNRKESQCGSNEDHTIHANHKSWVIQEHVIYAPAVSIKWGVVTALALLFFLDQHHVWTSQPISIAQG